MSARRGVLYGTITTMRNLFTKRERMAMWRMLGSVAIEVLTIPFAMVFAWAIVLGFLASLVGLPITELAFDFIRETAGPVVALQAKMLLGVGAVGALWFIVGQYRIEALVCHVAGRLNADALRLTRLWSMKLVCVRMLLTPPASFTLWLSRWNRIPRLCMGFDPSEMPQLE